MNEFSGCPGSSVHDFRSENGNSTNTDIKVDSQLRQWPIQLHLVAPTAPYYEKADVLLTADCVAYALGGYHNEYLKGKAVAIACPKLDDGQDVYLEKIKSWFDDAKINTLTVMTMQVPCCSGLVSLAKRAANEASRKIPVKSVIVSLKGEILSEEWL